MALHTELSIFRDTYALLSLSEDLIVNMPREVKRSLGDKIREECLTLTTLIGRANAAQDKVPHITGILEGVQRVEVLYRVSREKQFVHNGGYGRVVKLTQSIGKQANGWRSYSLKRSATRPVA